MEAGHVHRLSRTTFATSAYHRWINVCLLIYINFLNYTDRYLLAGILIDLQREFQIGNDLAGLIQTLFLIVYTISAPFFGYIGDRYNRKWLLIFSVISWNVGNVTCSFATNFWVFCLYRSFLAVGQACFTIVAPSVISDLVLGDKRSIVLGVFYTAIPAGTGLSYIVSTQMTQAFHDWRWGLRATPVLAIPNILMLIFGLREPQRGEVEGGTGLETSTWREDMVYLLTNPSFMFSTLAFVTIAFTTGITTWWAFKLTYLGFKLKYDKVNEYTEGSVFGLVSTFSGLMGLVLGYLLTFRFKEKCPTIEPIVCGIGLVLSAPLLTAATYLSLHDKLFSYLLLFFGFVFMNLNWAIIVDICFLVVVPSRRASAIGMQLLIGHGFGDIESPYLTGFIAEFLYAKFEEDSKQPSNEFHALQYAYFMGCVAEVIGGFFFFLNSVYYVRDIRKVKKLMEADPRQQTLDALQDEF